MILSDRDIKKALETGRISVEPLFPGSIQPASIDLHLDKTFLVFKRAEHIMIDVKRPVTDLMEKIVIDEDRPFVLHPGEFALGSTVEETGVGNDIVARLEGKSSLGRLGIIIHATAGYLDPGNKLHMTLELHNVGQLPVLLYYKMPIAQMSYSPLTSPAENPYGSKGLNSKYFGDKIAKESMMYKNFNKGSQEQKNMYEVEIKSLLVSKEQADRLLEAMSKNDLNTKEKARSRQLNHYFLLGDFSNLLLNLQGKLSQEQLDGLKNVIQKGQGHSVRTRKADDRVIFVVKAVADDTNSSNGTARIEFETALPTMTIEEIDQLLLDSGFPYQAKWSRDRVEYHYKDYTVAIDKNAGYGYLAEFEKVTEDKERIESLKQDIRAEMGALGIEELPQDRLDRMFQHYNQHWNEYYGTDRVFVLE